MTEEVTGAAAALGMLVMLCLQSVKLQLADCLHQLTAERQWLHHPFHFYIIRHPDVQLWQQTCTTPVCVLFCVDTGVSQDPDDIHADARQKQVRYFSLTPFTTASLLGLAGMFR